MKLFISFILIITSINVTAQDWFPFPVEQKSYFQYNGIYIHGQDSTISIHFCDSVKDYGTHKSYLFDYTTDGYGNCYEPVLYSPHIYYAKYIDDVRPDSVINKNDSLYFYYSDDYTYAFYDSILFFPQTKKDSSWFSSIDGTGYNRIKFTCDSIYYDTLVNGVMDSLKLFSLQTYNNGNPIVSGLDSLTLILSKNYGFKQLVSFYNTNKETPLIGIDSFATSHGFTQPQLLDYFHLAIGDVIVWKEDFHDYDIMNNQSYIRYHKDSLISLVSTPDSVIYTFNRSHSYGGQTIITDTYDNSTMGGFTASTSILVNEESSAQLYSSSNLFFTNDTIINRKYDYQGIFYNDFNCSTSQTADLWCEQFYNTYYGLYKKISGDVGGTKTWTIEGSVINGVQTGNVWNVGINENSLAQNFEIYPNPTDGIFKVKGKNIDKIEVFNISGNLIQSQMVKNTINYININNQPKGFYFIKAFFKSGSSKVEKLILN